MRSSLLIILKTLATCVFLLLSYPAAAGREIPIEALLGSREKFLEWRSQFQGWYADQLDGIANFRPSGHTFIGTEELKGVTLVTVQFSYPAGTPLFNRPSGGVLAVPREVEKRRPMIIATHGHEFPAWGAHPLELFKKEDWPFQMAQAGYMVWAPVTMYHGEEIRAVAEERGYPLLWTKIISEGIDYGQKHLWKKPGGEYAAAGLSSGAMVSYLLMAYRTDIKAGIFAGAEQDLDFVRREYRIAGHPDCWEIEGINSYTAIQALLAPRPIQFQSGRKDPFFPSGVRLPGNGVDFAGTTRAQLSTEVGGNALALRSIYEIYGERDSFEFFIHDGGHEMRSAAALKFLEQAADTSTPIQRWIGTIGGLLGIGAGPRP